MTPQQRQAAPQSLGRSRLASLAERFGLEIQDRHVTENHHDSLLRARTRRRWILPAAVVLLASILASGCLAFEAEEGLCSPKDTSYGCCLKYHPNNPSRCGATEKEAAEVLRQLGIQHSPSPGARIATGVATSVAANASHNESSRNDSGETEALLADVTKILSECAQLANEQVNKRRFGGDPTEEQCRTVVGLDKYNEPITVARELGEQKHIEAQKCAESRLGEKYPGRFSLEQRYRYDAETKQKRLYRKNDPLEGTVKPDVVIHSGDPMQALAVYDFKFPCLRGNPPLWRVYRRGPYRDLTQGELYNDVFDVRPIRVTPWEVIL